MARYIKQSPRQVQSMYNPIDIGFYAGILNSAQQNLNEASKIQAAYEDDIYNIKTFDPTTKETYIKKAQEAIGNELDKDFVSPANVAKGVARASKVLAPFKNVNERQLELAKQAEQFKLMHGANALYTDPTKISLTTEDGRLLTPEELKFTGMNAEDLDKLLDASEKGRLTSVYDKPVESDLPYKYKFETYEGMSPEDKYKLYGPNGERADQLAEMQIASAPDILNIFNGNKEAAKEYLKNRNLATVGKYAYSKTSKYVDDDWSLYMAKKRLEEKEAAVNPDTPFYDVDGKVTKTELNYGDLLAKASGSTQVFNWDKVPFNADGNLMAVGLDTKITSRTTGMSSVLKGEANPNYRETRKQLDAYKKILTQQGITVKSDKDVIEKIKEAANNSANFWGTKNEAISDLYEGNNLNPFKDSNGGYKDASSTAELEYYDEKKGKWIATTATELADITGLDGSKEGNSISTQLTKATDKTIDYWGNKPKLTGSVIAADGSGVAIRHNMANNAATKYATPLATAKQMLLTPGEHRIEFEEDNLGFIVQVAPTPATVSGKTMLVNRITSIEPIGDITNEENAKIVNSVLNSTSPETTLISLARNYRDWGYNNKGVIYKKKNPAQDKD